MTKKERFLAFANFEPVDRVPRYALFTSSYRDIMTRHLGRSPSDAYAMDTGRGAGLRPPDGYVAPDYSRYHPGYIVGENGFSIDRNGCGHLNHGFHHFTEYISPLRKTQRFEELEQYPLPDNTDWLDDRMREAAQAAHEEGDFAVLMLGHIYENAWQIRGYEPFLMDLLVQPEWSEFLLEHFCRNHERTARAAARAGYDCIQTGDDIANQNDMMFSPELWRRYLKPRWARVYAAAREIKPDIQIWYHSDGNITSVIDDLIEIGVTILNPVQPECMDPVAIRKRYGKRLAFDGCIGTQSTFPFGTSADMHRCIESLAAALDARHGGLMLSPTHVLEPEVPPTNVQAFFDACDRV